MRCIVEQLVAKRDERRDGFAKVMLKAMHERLGSDAEEVGKILRFLRDRARKKWPLRGS